MFNIAKKKLGWETFWDSVKFTWDSTFVDALGPRDAIEIKPKSNTACHTGRVLWEELLIHSRFHWYLQADEWSFCPLNIMNPDQTVPKGAV